MSELKWNVAVLIGGPADGTVRPFIGDAPEAMFEPYHRCRRVELEPPDPNIYVTETFMELAAYRRSDTVHPDGGVRYHFEGLRRPPADVTGDA